MVCMVLGLMVDTINENCMAVQPVIHKVSMTKKVYLPITEGSQLGIGTYWKTSRRGFQCFNCVDRILADSISSLITSFVKPEIINDFSQLLLCKRRHGDII